MAPHSCNCRQPHVSACHCEERGGRPATGQSVLLRQGIAESSTSGEYETRHEFAMAARSCTRRHPASFCMSLRGAKRRGNPSLLRQHITESNTLGESEKRYEFALRITNLQSFSAGMRIATSRGGCPAPRNDMQKEGRVRGCKDVVRNDMPPPLSLRGAKRRGNPFSLQ